MISPSGPWTLGTLIGLPIALLVVLLILGFAVFAFADDERGIAAGATAVALGLVVAIASPIGMYPYSSEYHQWRTVHGKVEQVSSRLIAADKSMSQRFVVVIGGRPFAVDDTRASLLKAGDTVTLKCKREWQYAAESGWACRWGGAA